MSEDRRCKRRLVVFKNVDDLVREGWTAPEIRWILEYQKLHGWQDEVPRLAKIEKTRRMLLKEPENYVAVREFWIHKNINKDIRPEHSLEKTPKYRKIRFLGKLLSLTKENEAPALEGAINSIKARLKGSYRLSKYEVAEVGLAQAKSYSRVRHHKKAPPAKIFEGEAGY